MGDVPSRGMCRGKSAGGRRCPGCQGSTARAKHNERRRKNRAIKAAIAKWAVENGAIQDEVDQLLKGPPIEAKRWAADRGIRSSELELPDGAHLGGKSAPRASASSVAAVTPPSVSNWMGKALMAQIGAVTALQGSDPAEQRLLDLPVGAREEVPGGGVNETRRVALGEFSFGFHKSFVGLDDGCAIGYGQSSKQQPVHEVAAWQLASALGAPWSKIVPPCVLRNINGVLGSLSSARPGRPYGVPVAEQGHAAGFFDALIGQQDRHRGNFLTTDDGQLTLIDHGFAFAKPGDRCNASTFVVARVQSDPELSSFERFTLKRLLANPDLFGLARVLEPDRAAALKARAERMLAAGKVLGEF